MRHTPCGCAPYGGVHSRVVGHDHWACRPRSGRRYRGTGLYAFGSSCTGAPNRRALRWAAFHDRRARPLGAPSAKRQTVQTNEFVRIW